MVWVDSIGIVNTASDFSNTDKLGSGLDEELWSKVSDVTETLDDETLSADSLFNTEFSDGPVIFEELSGAVEDTQTSWLSSAWGTALSFELSCGDGIGVDVGVAVILLISRLHPAHFSFTSSEIGARDVDSGSEGVLFGESNGVLSGDSFEFLDWIVFGVDWNAAFSASVGEVNDRALDAHETGKGFNFFEADVFSEPGTSFGGEFVGLVLTSVGLDGFDLAVF